MEMTSEQRIPAPREAVWAALNNTEILKAAMPGCESFEATGENQFDAQVTTKVGPVKARFKFKVNLSDIDPPKGYTINGEGQGGAAGFAKGSAAVSLAEDGKDTVLSYQVKANVGGKLAQLGSRLIDGTAKKLADEFFGNFIELIAGADPGAEPQAQQESEVAAESAKKDKPTWIYVVAGVIIAVLILRVFL